MMTTTSPRQHPDPTGSDGADLEIAGQISAKVSEARARAARGLADGTVSGIALAHQLTSDIDGIVTRLAAAELSAASGPTSAIGRVAMLATGGFGRREFAPYSDLDLIFLFEREPDEAGQQLAQRILHPLWDARLDAGHAVRSWDEALELPDSDLTAATALLDARFVAGDVEMAAEFLQA
jgi:[protein-PII] uridylyltransferase